MLVYNAIKIVCGCVCYINIFVHLQSKFSILWIVKRNMVRRRLEHAWLLFSGTVLDASISIDVHLTRVL